MKQTTSERDIANRVYDLDCKIYQATGSTLGKIFPAGKEISVNQMIKQIRKNKIGFLKTEMLLMSNMLKTVPDDEKKEELRQEFTELQARIKAFDPSSVIPTSIGTAIQPFPKNKKLIICISRQFGCRGMDIGMLLAERNDLPYYDKDILSMACEHMNMSSSAVEDYNNFRKKNRKDSYVPKFPRMGSSSNDALYFAERKVIRGLAEERSCIFIGRCADHILEKLGIPHISIYLCAPKEDRVQVEMARTNSTIEEARKLVETIDKNRQVFYKYYTGKTWGHPENYNICINTSIYGVKGSVALIEKMVDLVCNPEKE